MSRQIFLIDGQSFYASVEKAAHPEYRDNPVAVGDPTRMNGIILAACPIAKSRGVTTASRVGEALARCPELIVIRPRMQTYIQVSLLITKIFESYTDLVEPYSIDEQFLDVTGSIKAFGSPYEMAKAIQNHVLLSTGVWSRVGIGPTKILAKMATDNYAKKMPEGVFELTFEKLESTLWKLPVHHMFMVASAMTRHFTRMGLSCIGDIARMEFGEFKRRMRREMGKQSDIQAGYYWQTARGIDPSPVVSGIRHQLKSVSHGKALRWSLYRHLKDIEVVLLELVLEVCQRTRRHNYMGSVVSVSAAETDGERSTWFSRQTTLPQPTSLTHEVATAAHKLFKEHWSGLPLSNLSISLSQLTDDSVIQLTLFEDRSLAYRKEQVIDGIKNRYGSDAIMRASSLLEAGVARERAEQIGGHYR
ncbi:DNA polymerase IV 2 [Paenibacillus baekrokdamisoli]|uniref:DNA polymerase IV 2 n=1 Tax=Paenibacillus baekrokdamisoli TaxID=1712516 RepID=A0A3G9IW48_9BACL|nr:DNA polymerase IV [Paenibacillus baekrokdamisoli]MBB3072073.1 DNA polymerase-4 [Paenibacillus baekrokdamisoli]BBH20375.1 DNA polymerase IV 2 [Paenibacillus baekrokdamisoli]